MPTFEDLVTAVFCGMFGGNDMDAQAAHGQLAAYLVANGSQSVTVANNGRQYNIIAYGDAPGWKIVPGP
jgi:hypothetical protein